MLWLIIFFQIQNYFNGTFLTNFGLVVVTGGLGVVTGGKYVGFGMSTTFFAIKGVGLRIKNKII